MRKEYDFSNSIKNPYAKKVKKQISIKIEKEGVVFVFQFQFAFFQTVLTAAN